MGSIGTRERRRGGFESRKDYPARLERSSRGVGMDGRPAVAGGLGFVVLGVDGLAALDAEGGLGRRGGVGRLAVVQDDAAVAVGERGSDGGREAVAEGAERLLQLVLPRLVGVDAAAVVVDRLGQGGDAAGVVDGALREVMILVAERQELVLEAVVVRA
jgi:hypothetical protein